MNSKEILQKAIEKAKKNGYTFCEDEVVFTIEDHPSPRFVKVEYRYKGHERFYKAYTINDIIYSHNFAKALFPNEGYVTIENELNPEKGHPERLIQAAVPMHLWHIMQMTLFESPIKYLKKFI